MSKLLRVPVESIRASLLRGFGEFLVNVNLLGVRQG
jgi:hypothetical protein